MLAHGTEILVEPVQVLLNQFVAWNCMAGFVEQVFFVFLACTHDRIEFVTPAIKIWNFNLLDNRTACFAPSVQRAGWPSIGGLPNDLVSTTLVAIGATFGNAYVSALWTVGIFHRNLYVIWRMLASEAN
jgi:hypothetical protein